MSTGVAPMLSGVQKAAVVLAQLDTDRATKVLKAMSESEVVDLMSAVATLPPLDVDAVRGILAEFAGQAAALLQVGQGGVDVARRLLRERLGPSRAEEVLEQFLEAGQPRPLAILQRLEAHQIVSFLGDEHPQTIAVVLAHLSADHGAQVLGLLDEELRADVARRVAVMGRISPEVVQTMADTLEQKLSAVVRAGAGAASEVGGVGSIVAILNQSERSLEKQILATLEQEDPALAEQIRNEMFVFDDVVNLDDRTLQRVLRNVVPKDLAVALKGLEAEVREKFLRNLSERAAEDMAEEIEILGPTRLSQVEAAQQSIVKVVRELDAAGEIVLLRGDDELV
ncbi:MAG: flagellar motor switch protein FliG [Actinomycetota bacterium]|jgi:flagellar motor switch protein FliG|nr:flagellar motor switch protein FliG [Actinomycetota bacterium]